MKQGIEFTSFETMKYEKLYFKKVFLKYLLNIIQIKTVSDSRKKIEYEVLLYNVRGMPSCGCHAWTWTLLPCKHIFAVIDGRFPEVTWNNIPLSYSNSPFFTLDFEVVSTAVSGTIADNDDLCDEEDVIIILAKLKVR